MGVSATEHRELAPITCIYLGRSPAFARFVLQMATASKTLTGTPLDFIVADGTEVAARLGETGCQVTRIATFSRSSPWQMARNFHSARRKIARHIAETRPKAVVTLMSHVWSPLITPAIKRTGVRYATIVHDAAPHPGDWTAWVTTWLLRDAAAADLTITLSQAVSDQLERRDLVDPTRVVRLFHPDLDSAAAPATRSLAPDRAFRILFFGRIMAYKGLPLLIEAIEILRGEGVPVALGVAGEGDLEANRRRLEALNAEIINRWIDDDEATALLGRYDAMACSHIEASQSGVAALAFGHDMPVVALPVGGVAEQVADAETGVLANDVSAKGFADAVRRLIMEDGLYDRICRHLAATRCNRSMSRFVAELASAATANAQRPGDGAEKV